MSKGLYVYDPYLNNTGDAILSHRRQMRGLNRPRCRWPEVVFITAPKSVAKADEPLHRHEYDGGKAVWKRVLWIFVIIGFVIWIATMVKDYLADRRLSAPNKGGRPTIERISPLDDLKGN